MRRTALAQAALAVATGTAAWFLLMAVPGRAGAEVPSQPYPAAVIAAAVVLAVAYRGRPVAVAALLILPGLLAAPWTAPRGDGDGLWLLVFPALLWWGVLAGAAHAATRALLQRYRRG